MPPVLLDTYAPERWAFTVVTGTGLIARRMRLEVVRRLLPALFRLRAMRRLMFRTISRTLMQVPRGRARRRPRGPGPGRRSAAVGAGPAG